MLLGNGFLPMFAGGGTGKRIWDFAAGMPSGASILRSGGNATYFDATGVMQVVSGSDTARRNYNPASLTFQGVYVERAATNLCLYSEALAGTGWSRVAGMTVSSNALASPDGATTADKLVSTESTNNQSTWRTFTASAQALNSVYAKAGEYSWLGLGFGVNANADGAYFNLATGVIGTVTAGTTATIIAINNGWYLCTVRRTLSAGTRYIQHEVHSADNQGNWVGGSGGIYLWGSQISAISSSYIPTTSAAVTRNAESLVLQSVAASTLRVTFEDNSTQDLSVTPGTVTIAATALNRSLVRKVEEL